MDFDLFNITRFFIVWQFINVVLAFFITPPSSSQYVRLFIITSTGSYGIVCSALDTQTNTKVAIKKVIRCFDHHIFAVRLLREVKILGFLKHPNVIDLKHVQLPFPDKDTYTELYMYTDLMDTDLKTIIQSPQELTNDHIQFFMYQILKAVNYIHSGNVIHRDLVSRSEISCTMVT